MQKQPAGKGLCLAGHRMNAATAKPNTAARCRTVSTGRGDEKLAERSSPGGGCSNTPVALPCAGARSGRTPIVRLVGRLNASDGGDKNPACAGPPL